MQFIKQFANMFTDLYKYALEKSNIQFPTLINAQPSRPIQMVFNNLCAEINGKVILNNISGSVKPGQVLAIMGASGSGKTTLLNCLSGRHKVTSGDILLNKEKLSKKWRKRICYVLQQDIFFPDLTVRETLQYTAELRLPDTLTFRQKMHYVDHMINVLELENCQNTIIGDYMKRGLSGGEKKRVNIACELLTNPSIMLLDEPTSGLDSHSAFQLMSSLKKYALNENKAIILTVHQPSSQIFHMFDKLLLLCDGELAYFGNANQVIDFFANIDLKITQHYNPADFILEQIKGPKEVKNKILESARNSQFHESFSTELLPGYYKYYDKLSNDGHFTKIVIPSNHSIKFSKVCEEKGGDKLCQDFKPRAFSSSSSSSSTSSTSWESMPPIISSSLSYNLSDMTESDYQFVWPTSFWTQFKVLMRRNFHEAKPRMLSKLNWIQTVGLGVLAGMLWFQLERSEQNLSDIQGWMFFSTTYWMLFAHFGALTLFPPEREVVNKERQSGSYRLSAYYLAKMFGELPLTITLPTVYHIISYPMLGCYSFQTFFKTLGFLLLNTIVAESVGFFVGACCLDMQRSITISALYTLATQLFGGYLVKNISESLKWLKYFSMIHYAYQNMQIVEFGEIENPIRCGNPSKFDVCRNSTTISASDILEMEGNYLPLWINTFILLMFLLTFRLMGYIVLRFFRAPK